MSEIGEDKISEIKESNDVFEQANAAWDSPENNGLNNPAFFPAETASPLVFLPTQKPTQEVTQVASEIILDDGEKKKKRKPKKPPKVPKRESPPDSG